MNFVFLTGHKVKVKILATQSCSTLCDPLTVAHQVPLSMKYWSGLPFAPLGNLPDPGIELVSPALQTDILTSEQPGKPNKT